MSSLKTCTSITFSKIDAITSSTTNVTVVNTPTEDKPAATRDGTGSEISVS